MTTVSALSCEIRQTIRGEVGKTEDLNNLLQVDRRTRAETIDIIPGGVCTNEINVHKLTVIVNWHCSGSCWLESAVTESPTQKKPKTFCISDLDSPLARNLTCHRRANTVVQFRAPDKGHHLAALLLLRAKLCDVLTILAGIGSSPAYKSLPFTIRLMDKSSPSRGTRPFFVNLPPDFVKEPSFRRSILARKAPQ